MQIHTYIHKGMHSYIPIHLYVYIYTHLYVYISIYVKENPLGSIHRLYYTILNI